MQPPKPYKLSVVLGWIVSGRIDWRMARLVEREEGIWSTPEYFEANRLSLQAMATALAGALEITSNSLSAATEAHLATLTDLAAVTQDRDAALMELKKVESSKQDAEAQSTRREKVLKDLETALGPRRWKRLLTRAGLNPVR